jgi:hypothetical protein
VSSHTRLSLLHAGGELRAMVDEPRRDFCIVEQLGLIDGGFREAREGITSTSPLRRSTRRQCYWQASRSVYLMALNI